MTIQVQLYSNMEAYNSKRPSFERIVQSCDSVEFPYSQILSSLKVLFCEFERPIVTFNVQ